jgi:two-component system cell cycle response regulator
MNASHPQAGKPRILIADDNPQILELIEAYLEPLGAHVLTSSDGQATLATIERERPDIVLLDVMMPKRSGFEVCRSIKDDRRLRDIPVILITALNEFGDMERARECGADDFLSKPVNKLELIDRVRGLLEIRNLKSGAKPGNPS